MSPLLTARDLTKTYGVQPALRGVDLDLHEGEIVAVRGRSGCGKSTLLHCLSGIIRPDGGEVHFRGDRIDDTAEAYRSELRRSAVRRAAAARAPRSPSSPPPRTSRCR